MESAPSTTAPAALGPIVGLPVPIGAASGDRCLSELGELLGQLGLATAASPLPPTGQAIDNQLVQVRLGIASSLFAALRCKSESKAGHSLRVALTCSAWTARMGLPQGQRDMLEIAALLHDIGVIGVPDRILVKPERLDTDEAAVMAQARQMSLDILRHSCSAPEVLEIIEYLPAWFDGSRTAFARRGIEIPLGARLIAIVEGFDAMTTDQVWRPARSQERALAELFVCAGTQFDPELVRQFAEFQESDLPELHRQAIGRWLQALDPAQANSCWHLNCVPSSGGSPDGESLFQSKLLDNMYDGVVFVDAGFRIVQWNHGAERLTGIAAGSIHQHPWHPSVLSLADEKGQAIDEADCPIAHAIRSGVQSLRRLTICGRNGRSVSVDSHTIPVMSEDGTLTGAILVLHDASSEISLEHRCQRLHEKATKDPLTQVANRAEFDRVHEMFTDAHRQQKVPCSLVMCDLDHFKQVNDTYGHQAGDDAIRTLAALLKCSCRPGDLVARYGGEEFVILCADCDNATATRRADLIRKTLAQVAVPRMNGRAVTASFGVTEIQPGDTPETMLRRADRALLMAKAKGRNTVVQLGAGGDEAQAPKSSFWCRRAASKNDLYQQVLVTPVPIKMAVEKLRGFVADHRAKILKVEGNEVQLEIEDKRIGGLRRLGDRPSLFCLELRFVEERSQKPGEQSAAGGVLRTKIYLAVSLQKSRDRRREDVCRRAREVLVSFRSYLMASEVEDSESDVPSVSRFRRMARMLLPWGRGEKGEGGRRKGEGEGGGGLATAEMEN